MAKEKKAKKPKKAREPKVNAELVGTRPPKDREGRKRSKEAGK